MKHLSIIILVALLALGACKESDSKETTTTDDSTNTSKTHTDTPAVNKGTTSDTGKGKPVDSVKPKENAYAKASFETKVIDGKEGSFGYEIAVTLNGQTQRIRQTHKPSLPGIKGFDTKEQAQKVADFVVNKIKTKGFPPTVTPEELAKLGVVK